MTRKQRILSGMRPTGQLHLGNYHGALKNWIDLQDQYDCFYFVADWHALTSDYEDTSRIAPNITQMVMDWLSVGLTPERCTIFIQSSVKAHAELFLILSMITPVPWLERNPTYKDQIVQIQNKDLSTFGFLGYPVLQAADIIMYKAHKVPVGIDQVPHVEITREITRRFNYLYGEVFPEPDALLTQTPKVLGFDRRKMSKSYNNAIFLADAPDEIAAKVAKFITDPDRKRRNDPGNPEVCNVFDFHKIYSPRETVAEIDADCRKARVGCVDCKKRMAANLAEALAPIREQRAHYEAHPDLVAEIIAAGNAKACAVAEETMADVRSALNI